MNHVLSQGAALVGHAWLLGVTTVLFVACFLGWTWWAYSSANRERLDEAAWLPLREDEE